MEEVKEVKAEEVDFKPKYILSKGNAKKVLQQMLDYYEIDIDEIEEKKLKEAIKSGQARLVKAIRLGRIKFIFEDGIKVVQTLRSNSDEITYEEINGEAKTAMAGKQEDDFYGKSYALMGSLSGWGESAIKKLKGVDISLVEVLGMIFLSV